MKGFRIKLQKGLIKKASVKIGIALLLPMILFFVTLVTRNVDADSGTRLTNQDVTKYLFEMSLQEGKLSDAKYHLDQMYQRGGDSPYTALGAARIEFLYGNYEDAYILYQKYALLDPDFTQGISEEEITFYREVQSGDKPLPSVLYNEIILDQYLSEVNYEDILEEDFIDDSVIDDGNIMDSEDAIDEEDSIDEENIMDIEDTMDEDNIIDIEAIFDEDNNIDEDTTDVEDFIDVEDMINSETNNIGNGATETGVHEDGDIEESPVVKEETRKYQNITMEELTDQMNRIRDSIYNSIVANLESSNESVEKLTEALALVGQIADEYERFELGESLDQKALEDLVKGIIRLYKTNPELFTYEQLNQAYLQGVMMIERYDLLIDYATKSNHPIALAMVANLYQTGLLKEKDFDDDFVQIKEDEVDAVIDQCLDIVDRLEEKDIDPLQLDELSSIVDVLETTKDEPYLAEIDRRMDPEVVDESEQSKAHLQKSGVQYELGDEVKGNQSLQNALDTADKSKDSTYVEAMNGIVGIINQTGSKEDIKNIGSYLQDAYEQSLPVVPKETESEKFGETFRVKASELVSMKRAMINIGYIDSEKFPDITAQVQFSSVIDLKNTPIRVMDHGSEIVRFNLKKQKVESLSVYLICDISGSMSDSEQELKDAVTSYMKSVTQKEEVGLIGFSSYVEFDSGFIKRAEEMNSYIDELITSGGTDIYNAVYHGISNFKENPDKSNVIILLTDGNDESFSDQNSLSELRHRCQEKNITLYTIGLGEEISVELLENMAAAGNGQFIYSNDAISLQSFYEFIHKQIDNQYLLTYSATNLEEGERELYVANDEDQSEGKKLYYYSTSKEEPVVITPATTDDNDDTTDNIAEKRPEISDIKSKIRVTGVDQALFYDKGQTSNVFHVKGSGFSNAKKVNITMEGPKSYRNLTVTVVDDTKIKVETNKIEVGAYSLIINIDGQNYSLRNCMIFSKIGVTTRISFGKYQFRANQIVTTGTTTKLSGNVVMNDYLYFKGNVVLEGDLKGDSIVLSESAGSYVSMQEKLPGLLGVFFQNKAHLPSFSRLVLYNDKTTNLDNYKTEKIHLIDFDYAAITFERPYVSVFPHKIDIWIGGVSFEFPFQKQILKYEKAKNPFTVAGNAKLVLTSKKLAAVGSFSGSKMEQIYFSVIPLNLTNLKIKFDTLKHDYSLGMDVSTTKLIPKILKNKQKDKVAYGFDVDFKGGKWDSVNLHVNFPVIVIPEPPVTLRNFKLGVSGMSKMDQQTGFLQKLTSLTLTGSTDISIMKLSDLISGLDAVFGDLSLITLKDTTAKVRINNFFLEFSTKVKLFGEVEIGNAKMMMGHYNYSNHLLNMKESEVTGFYIESNRGIDWNFGKNKIHVNGSTRVAINDMFIGAWSNGIVDYNVKFIKNFSSSVDGDVIAGLHNSGKQFTILVKGANLKANKSTGFKVTFYKGKLLPDVNSLK